MKNKKNIITIIIIINLILIVCVFQITNYCIDKYLFKIAPFIRTHISSPIQDNTELDIKNYETETINVKQIKFDDNSFNKFCGEERVKFGENYTKAPIIVLGCSYAYGHGLQKEDTFSYKLSNMTKRPVYNFSACGSNILDSFFQVYNDNYKNINNSEYVIYIYMHDHINRYLSIEKLYEKYETLFLENSTSPVIQNKIVRSVLKTPIIKLILANHKKTKILKGADILSPSNLKSSSNYLKFLMMFIYKQIKLNYPKAKFIIILYDEKIADMYNPINIKFDWEMQKSKIWDELAQETNGDIIIVRTEDITGFLFDKDYKLKEDIADWHPNAKAWEVFTPKFAKKYIN